MNSTRSQRKTRTRKNIAQVSDRPRLSVFRSNKYCYAQVIDINGNTLVGLSEKAVKEAKGTPIEKAKAVGLAIAQLATEKKITEVV